MYDYRFNIQLCHFQIMAVVVTVLGVIVSAPFQVFVHEDPNTKHVSQKWYMWIRKPDFYLVRKRKIY